MLRVTAAKNLGGGTTRAILVKVRLGCKSREIQLDVNYALAVFRRSTSRVSGFSFKPISTSMHPAIKFAPNNNGSKEGILEAISTETSGAHAPRINPALNTNPAEVFLIAVGNRSDKNAGMGPKPLVATIISNEEKIALSAVLGEWKRPTSRGIARIVEAMAKTPIARILPIL